MSILCATCFDRPAEPGSRLCADCDCQRAFARGNPQPLPSAVDAELAAGLEMLARHDAMLAAQDDAL
jgi:hypothetical protein